jgi:hypothetical protein
MTDLTTLSARALAGIILSRQASALEVVEAHLRAIEKANPSLNAVVQVAGGRSMSHWLRRVISRENWVVGARHLWIDHHCDNIKAGCTLDKNAPPTIWLIHRVTHLNQGA